MLAFGTSANPPANSEKMDYPSKVTVTYMTSKFISIQLYNLSQFIYVRGQSI